MNRYTLTRLKNLREDFVRSAEWRKNNKIKFSILSWRTVDSACAVGSAVEVPKSKTRKAGLRLEKYNTYIEYPLYNLKYHGLCSWNALCAFLGTDKIEEVEAVFIPKKKDGSRNFKPSDILKKLDRLILKVEQGRIS